VRSTRIFRTMAFRLMLISAALFVFSAAVLFGVIYWRMTNYALRQFQGGIMADAIGLADDAHRDGVAHAAEVITRRMQLPQTDDAWYLLTGAGGQRLAGNLPVGPIRPGWNRYSLGQRSGGHSEPVFVQAYAIPLPGGGWVVVGRDTDPLDDLHDDVVQAFAWAGGATILLAAIGGYLLSSGFLRRIDAINRTTQHIIAGDLGQRIAVHSNGDELDQLACNLNQMLNRIQALMDELHHVTDDIAHDLRTPLARMRQRLEDLRRNTPSRATYETAVERTIADMDAVLTTFNAMLRIAEIESGTRRAGFAQVDLSAICSNVADAYQPVAEENGQTLIADFAPDVVVQGDRALLTQMLANLVENALRHTPPRSKIELRLRQTEDGPVLTVADNGPGIPANERNRVLQRFYRLEASRTTPGSGLGLSLAAAVAQLHGISLSLADNRPGLKITLQFKPKPA
jgi:signal transduction histidine kinase